MTNGLDSLPTWVIALACALLIVGANELGFRLGQNKGPGLGAQAPSAIVQAATFTVLALLLGFSFAMALGRFDARRGTLLREANAIVTMFLRAQLLDTKTAAAVHADLRSCVAQRIAFAQADADAGQRVAADTQSSVLQADMWRLGVAAAQNDRSTTVPLFVASVNDTISVGTEERAVLTTHVPDIVIVALLLIALIASAMMGYNFGRQGERALIFKAAFAVMLAVALGLVLDLDRPQRGLIRVSLTPLQNAQQMIDATTPTYQPGKGA